MTAVRARLIATTLAAGALAAAGFAWSQATRTPPRVSAAHVNTAPQFMVGPLAPGASEAVVRGRYLAVVGDCVACHTPAGRPAFSGGRALNTPFGRIYSSNLTGDPQTGVGAWTPDQFWRAMHEGIGANGQNLYPAFPYPWFTRVSRADSDALLAYLKTVPAVNQAPPANALPFPLNIRFAVKGWNLLFFKPAAWRPDTAQPAAWNRGSYLVNVLSHCGACHTPKNALGADKAGAAFRGGLLDNWYAPDLTGQTRYGLGGWSEQDVIDFLKTGRSARGHAGGAMAEVVSDSTSMMTDADLHAIALYLKSLPASPDVAPAKAPESKVMKAGEAVYIDACTGCHRMGGAGYPGFFPPLKGHSGLQSPDGTNVVRVILEGARTAPTPTRPSPLSMPSFAWKLSDEQVADVATYVRNAWGNRAPDVSPGQVRKLRDHLEPQGPREQR